MAVLDATFLIPLFDRHANAPIDPSTRQPIADAHNRVRSVIRHLSKQKERIIIPAPALAESIVKISRKKRSKVVSRIEGISGMEIVPFTKKHAIEFAEIESKTGHWSSSSSNRAKMKFDRLILAMTIAEIESILFTDDEEFSNRAREQRIKVYSLRQIPRYPIHDSFQFT